MFRDTLGRDLNATTLSENVKTLLAARLYAQMMPGIDLHIALPQSDHMVKWLTQDPDRNYEMAFSMFCELAVRFPLIEERDTRNRSFFSTLPDEPTDWAAVSMEVAQLRRRSPLIPNQEIRGLAQQVAARDYRRDNIQEWAKRLSQLPFSDEE